MVDSYNKSDFLFVSSFLAGCGYGKPREVASSPYIQGLHYKKSFVAATNMEEFGGTLLSNRFHLQQWRVRARGIFHISRDNNEISGGMEGNSVDLRLSAVLVNPSVPEGS